MKRAFGDKIYVIRILIIGNSVLLITDCWKCFRLRRQYDAVTVQAAYIKKLKRFSAENYMYSNTADADLTEVIKLRRYYSKWTTRQAAAR